MKQYPFLLTVLLAGTFISCTSDAEAVPPEEPGSSGITLSLSPAEGVATKSLYRESDLVAIRNVWVMAVADDGFWKRAYYTEDDFTRAGSSVHCPAMTFRTGTQVTFYMAANMGDLTAAAAGSLLPDGTPDMARLEYLLPADINFNTASMPMAGQKTVFLSAPQTGIPAVLTPLLARLEITIDKNGITDHVTADVLSSGSLKVKNANRRLRPFGTSAAESTDDLFSVDIDRESFSASSSFEMTHSNVVLYVPENEMGDLLSSESTQWDKGNLHADGKERSTYLAYSCSKNAASDGVGGALTYKAYLGDNVTHNFSVHRNMTYACTLALSWNGFFFDGDWRVDNGAVSDGRILTLSPTPHTARVDYADMGSVQRSQQAALYVNFSRDSGNSWVHGAKDIAAWPYGWDLYIDGIKQAAGTAATASGDLAWSYTGTEDGDRISLCPGPSAVSGKRHTLQVWSADGRVSSNTVSFIIQSQHFDWNEEDARNAREWQPGKTYQVRYTYDLGGMKPVFSPKGNGQNEAWIEGGPLGNQRAFVWKNVETGEGSGYVEFMTSPLINGDDLSFDFEGGRGDINAILAARIEAGPVPHLRVYWSMEHTPVNHSRYSVQPTPSIVFKVTTQGTTDEDCDVHGLTPLIDGTLQIPIYLYFNWSPSDAYDANFLSGRPLTLYIYDNLTFDERPTASPEEKVFDDVFDAEKTMREMILTCQIRDGVGTVFFDWDSWTLCSQYNPYFGPAFDNDILYWTLYCATTIDGQGQRERALFNSAVCKESILDRYLVSDETPGTVWDFESTCHLNGKED